MKLKLKPLHLKTVTYSVLFAIILVALIVANVVVSSAAERTRGEISRVVAENSELEGQLRDLQDALAFIKTDKGIELYARAQGMSMPGEVHYSAGNN